MTKNDLAFFQPLWRRIAVTGLCGGWTLWELSNGEQFWAFLSAVLTLYCVWNLFIKFEKQGDENEPGAQE